MFQYYSIGLLAVSAQVCLFCFINTIPQRSWGSPLGAACSQSDVTTKSEVQNSLLGLVAQVFDQSALSTEAKEEMYKLYPNARRAHLKTGGNFPYLCRSAEVNLYIQVSSWIQSMNVFSYNSRRKLLLSFFCYLTSLCALCCWYRRAGLGAAVSMLGQLWGFSVSELLYSRAVVSPSQKLLRRNVSLLPKHCAPTPVSVLFPVPNRSICCSSTAPGTQPLIPPWSVQRSWKSRRSAFTPATSTRSSRLESASGAEALLWWNRGIALVVFLCTISCSHSAFPLC